jgi:hypothetical protein
VLGNRGCRALVTTTASPRDNTTEVRGAQLKVVATVTFNGAGQAQHLVTIAMRARRHNFRLNH